MSNSRPGRFQASIVFLVLSTIAVTSAGAATWYVDIANVTGVEDGTQANPYRSIQDGINDAGVGDVVLVAAGEYFESISFRDGVTVLGEDKFTTIINATDKENSVVTFDGSKFDPRLAGFTLKGGTGDLIGSIAGVQIFVGGGVRIINSPATVENCIITENFMTEGWPRGGGVYIEATGVTNNPRLNGNVITNNIARSSTNPGRGEGGGVYSFAKATAVSMADNLIQLNQAYTGGGIFSESISGATANILRNDIRMNQAEEGGGIYTRDDNGTETFVINNLVAWNGSAGPGIIDCDDDVAASNPDLDEVCNDGIDNDCNPGTPDLFDTDSDGDSCDLDCDDEDPTLGPSVVEDCLDRIDNDCDGSIDFFDPDNLVLIEFGDPMNYVANNQDPMIGITWTTTGFDDSAWSQGDFGVGFDTDTVTGAGNLILTSVPQGSASVYTRSYFEIDDPMNVAGLFVAADWDDGYVAWINGEEVYRSPEMPVAGDPAWDEDPDPHESSNGLVPDYGALIDISAEIEHLVSGTNLLAIGVYADVPGVPADLVIVPRLSMAYGTEDPDCLCEDLDGDGYAGGLCALDCNDSDPSVNPGMAEVCADAIDNDCDPSTLDLADADSDGFTCEVDCDDTDATVNPSATELYCDGLDNDCNPLTEDVVDIDGDFFLCDVDCNDNHPLIKPTAIEACFDGVDNNCDGFFDDADLECRCDSPVDIDGDGYRCRDCNDGDPGVNPGANEICGDGIDNDCRNDTEDVFDGDADGFACDMECDDIDPSINPDAIEICNDGIDNDCDTLIDDLDPDCTGCPDVDMDGYPAGTCNVDCNDSDPDIHPGAVEVCNDTIDNDCDGATTDVDDVDGDGFDCTMDCNDSDASISPNAAEKCDDTIDNDCDGLIDVFDPDLVVVQFGSPMRYLANESDPGVGFSWVTRLYDDVSWSNGLHGAGYQVLGVPDDARGLILTTVPQGTMSVYTRTVFHVGDVTGVDGLMLGADWDDAYAVWINGTEVHRSAELPPSPAPLAWDTTVAQHESSNGTTPDYGVLIDVSAAIPDLVEGENILAAALWNDVPMGGGISSDLVLVPRLSLVYGDDDADCFECEDFDGDGYAGGACAVDCNDTNPQIHPAAAEIGCDGQDNDCDGGTPDLLDADGDGDDCSVDCDDDNDAIGPSSPEIPCDFADNDCNAFTFDVADQDLDGFTCDLDCDDMNDQVNPSQTEIGCDLLDNDCDSLTADNLDNDRDGFFCVVDCDDADPLVNPGVPEHCNDGVDNDCDGLVDNDVGVEDPDCFDCADTDDSDGDNYVCNDCNDDEPLMNPSLTEICNDGLDNDCDPGTADVGDLDGDGFDCLLDCDDFNPFTYPGAPEICNDNVDNDCEAMTPDIFDNDMDGYFCHDNQASSIDCDDGDAATNPAATELCDDGIDNDCDPGTPDVVDGDLDGWSCNLDCDDDDLDVFPGADELCDDGIDNDCDPLTPDHFDADGDGATCEVDCDDGDATRFPGAVEHCADAVDNDCDTQTDGADLDCTSCSDGDGDDYACGDCNDGDPSVNPGAPEVCNDTVDNDCNPATLDVDDLDLDGYSCATDCDDLDPAVNPAATEICNDLIDNDCNPGTVDDFNVDGDAYTCITDCDDNDANINPGQVEISCDGRDNDCDPLTEDIADLDGDTFFCADKTIRGGGISSVVNGSGSLTVANNTIADNRTVPLGIGGGVFVDDLTSGGTSILVNNIVANNDAFLGSGLDHTRYFGDVHNNAFFNNNNEDLYNGGGSGAVMSSNLFVDPLFNSAAELNYRLRAASSLIDAADSPLAPLNDLDRIARPFDGDEDLVALPDLGAYEFPSGEVVGLVFVSRDELNWNVRPGETSYNLYRGRLLLVKNGQYTQDPVQNSNDQFCGVTPGMLPFLDPYLPTIPLTNVFYLVTLTTPSFEGSLGIGSSGALRLSDFPCP